MIYTLIVLLPFLAVVLLTALWVVSMTVLRQVSGLVSGQSTQVITGESGVQANPNVPAAQAATLTVRTNGTSGSLTMTSSTHGIITGQVVDLYWTGGRCYGAVVGTVSGTTVPIASVAGGTAFPSTSTVINVGVRVSAPFALTGDDLNSIAMVSPSTDGYIVIADGSSNLLPVYLQQGDVYLWTESDLTTNPLDSEVPTQAFMSQSVTTGVNTGMAVGAVVTS